jgi:hypothetical protein
MATTIASTTSKATLSKPKNEEDMKKVIAQLKVEFNEKFHNDGPSLGNDRLNEYQFLTILGQGAFGVVVSIKS